VNYLWFLENKRYFLVTQLVEWSGPRHTSPIEGRSFYYLPFLELLHDLNIVGMHIMPEKEELDANWA